MKRILILGAIVIGLAAGGLVVAFRPGDGQAAETSAATCPHGQDIDAMREHMDAVHGPGTFDAMHTDGTMTPGMIGTDEMMGQHTDTMQGHHGGGGMMGSGMMR